MKIIKDITMYHLSKKNNAKIKLYLGWRLSDRIQSDLYNFFDESFIMEIYRIIDNGKMFEGANL